MPLRSFAPFLTCLILICVLCLLSAPIEDDQFAEKDRENNSPSPFRSLFSLHGPSSLFAPAAVISLTDDNSTFFNARPAAFGPPLPRPGLSGPVWAGHSFADEDDMRGGLSSADSGELGCGDVIGWENVDEQPLPSQGRDNGVLKGPGDIQGRSEAAQDDAIDQLKSGREGSSMSAAANNHSSADIQGKIALLSRGGCGFAEKVLWAQRRGAKAVIVGDNLSGGPLVTMYAKGDTSNVTIPSLFTSHMTAHLLASLVPQGSDVASSEGTQPADSTVDHLRNVSEPHTGLWVTLSLATGGVGPFFHTLFVLVVSPLLTLAIVYTMLFVRARIRRRRWRAPKSIVDRLPVRIYRAVSSRTSTHASATPTGHHSPSATTPLLIGQRDGREGGNEDLEQGLPSSSYGSMQTATALQEKPAQEIAQPRPKYNQKQIECAVCLEEYEDGVSRVMSLPCGHDFHADCVTPWLTTKRRTCPICKGDVVRSLGGDESRTPPSRSSEAASEADVQTEAAETINRSPSAALPLILRHEEIDDLDLERDARSRRG
ncbi:MAG: hypothetical protein Q9159_004038 [Coniocarpon cinnabarinum]